VEGEWVQNETLDLGHPYAKAKFQSYGEWLVVWTRKTVAVWNLAERRQKALFEDGAENDSVIEKVL
jgi:hypothetical protein